MLKKTSFILSIASALPARLPHQEVNTPLLEFQHTTAQSHPPTHLFHTPLLKFPRVPVKPRKRLKFGNSGSGIHAQLPYQHCRRTTSSIPPALKTIVWTQPSPSTGFSRVCSTRYSDILLTYTPTKIELAGTETLQDEITDAPFTAGHRFPIVLCTTMYIFRDNAARSTHHATSIPKTCHTLTSSLITKNNS